MDGVTHSYICQSTDDGGLDTLLDMQLTSSDATLFPSHSTITENKDLLVSYSHRQPSFPPEIDNGTPPDWYFG